MREDGTAVFAYQGDEDTVDLSQVNRDLTFTITAKQGDTATFTVSDGSAINSPTDASVHSANSPPVRKEIFAPRRSCSGPFRMATGTLRSELWMHLHSAGRGFDGRGLGV